MVYAVVWIEITKLTYINKSIMTLWLIQISGFNEKLDTMINVPAEINGLSKKFLHVHVHQGRMIKM